MRTEDTYGKNMKRNEVMESARMIRRKFLRYQQAMIVYSLSHKKLMELAKDAGAIYRKDGTVLINKDIFDEYLERFHEVSGMAPEDIGEEEDEDDKKMDELVDSIRQNGAKLGKNVTLCQNDAKSETDATSCQNGAKLEADATSCQNGPKLKANDTSGQNGPKSEEDDDLRPSGEKY